jgi:hypothetical protein
MEGFNKHVSTLLMASAAAVGFVSFAAYLVLSAFEDIFREFNAQFPLLLSWVFPSFRFWWLIALFLLVTFVLSLQPKLSQSLKFNRLFNLAAIAGFCTSLLLIAFSAASIYWPVMQNA